MAEFTKHWEFSDGGEECLETQFLSEFREEVLELRLKHKGPAVAEAPVVVERAKVVSKEQRLAMLKKRRTTNAPATESAESPSTIAPTSTTPTTGKHTSADTILTTTPPPPRAPTPAEEDVSKLEDLRLLPEELATIQHEKNPADEPPAPVDSEADHESGEEFTEAFSQVFDEDGEEIATQPCSPSPQRSVLPPMVLNQKDDDSESALSEEDTVEGKLTRSKSKSITSEAPQRRTSRRVGRS